MYNAKHLNVDSNELNALNFLKKLVENRLKYAKKKGSKRAANYFNNWLAFNGKKCTEEGARKIIESHSAKFEALLPGKSHKAFEKWHREAKELELI